MRYEDVDLAVQNQQQQEEVCSGFDFLAIYLLHLYLLHFYLRHLYLLHVYLLPLYLLRLFYRCGRCPHGGERLEYWSLWGAL